MTRPMTPVPKPPRRVVKKARQPLRAKKRMKRFNAKRGGHKFPKNVDRGFRAWVREHAPCILAGHYRPLGQFAGIGAVESHRCNSPVRCCHIRSRGAGGVDQANIYGGCDAAHDEQGRLGIFDFQERWRVNVTAEAERLWAQYQAGATPTQEHSND